MASPRNMEKQEQETGISTLVGRGISVWISVAALREKERARRGRRKVERRTEWAEEMERGGKRGSGLA
jgi:hypothetical protein